MKILFVCRNFDRIAGGIERIATELMNEQIERGNEVSLFTWDGVAAKSHYPMNHAINWKKMGIGNPALKASFTTRIKRMQVFRHFVQINGPDIIICFQVGCFIFAAMSCLFIKIPIIAAERNSPSLYDYADRGSLKKIIFYMQLMLASKITIQIESYRKLYPRILRKKIVTISNPVILPGGKHKKNYSLSKESTIIFLNVGRLSVQKNQQFLLKAFSRIRNNLPNAVLNLVGGVGDERYRDLLMKTVERFKLQKCIKFFGRVQNVDRFYREAHLFLFPSLWEGFPNALAEAMSYRLPAIGLRETHGVNFLIKNGVTGLTAPQNTEIFSSTVIGLATNNTLLEKMSLAAYERIKQFEPKEIHDKWAELFNSMIS